MSRVYRALGSLDPVIYFQNADGKIVLPPTTEDARWIFEQKFKKEGYEWYEADTLQRVDDLQRRLVEIDRREKEAKAERDDRTNEERWAEIGDKLRQRMASSSTTPYERDFIALYLKVREDKREKHRQRWLEGTSYLWAREMDGGTKVADRMPSEEGDRWNHKL